MPNDDTIKLLRECSAGTEMAISSINEVIENVKDTALYSTLAHFRSEHQHLKDEIHVKLSTYHDSEKSPNPMAKAMSWSKIKLNLMLDSSSKEISTLMRDGCNMGIESLQKYLEQYPTASSEVKSITERLIKIERDFHDALDSYV